MMTKPSSLHPDIEQLRAVGEREAVAILGLSLQTVRNWRHLGRGPRYCKYGRAVRYLLADLLDWREQQCITPHDEAKG
jgi:predicted DNA-binding transcriptional regulator AlpA